MTDSNTHFDYICIGGGSGGIASANRASRYGKKAAIIEAKDIGGTCVNVGCVPKKAMWYGAQVAEAIHKYSADYGFDLTLNNFSWEKLVESREAYIDRIHQSYDRVLGNNGVTLIKGFAKFIDNNTLDIDGVIYTADHITIATGGRPIKPIIPGAEIGLDSDGFFDLKHQPKRVVVVGAGYIAVELAGVLHSLGSETHLVVRREKALRSFDSMLSDTLSEMMQEEGIKLHAHSEITRIEELDNKSIVAHLSTGDKIEADVLIWAIGRDKIQT
jgi:glutathione reductase (NADPH)